jgi:hypothetical protein
MLPISRRHAHYVFGVMQSALTTLIATLIASIPLIDEPGFALHLARSWLLAWLAMLPVVIFAAPLIRRAATALTREEDG